MRYLILFSLFFSGCETLNSRDTKNCVMEGNKEVCHIDSYPLFRDGWDKK